MNPARPRTGVRIAGTGSYLPAQRVSNADLAALMDTSDEWIVQRTGIRERRKADPAKGETTWMMSAEALRRALDDARIAAPDLDLIVVGTVSAEMATPSVACRVSHAVGAGRAAAFDLSAACSGFVYGLNIAQEMIRAGVFRTAAIIGAEVLTNFVEYNTHGRGCAILFGDGAGAAIIRASDDPAKGCVAHAMHADGSGWKDLYIPRKPSDLPPGADPAGMKMGTMQMNGREVFKFAVGTFQTLIAETLEKASLRADEIDQFICHQSNIRILEAARERFGIPPEKLYINIDRVGNTSAASGPICLDELRKAGRVREGQKVMFVAFGAGLTWASSLWQL